MSAPDPRFNRRLVFLVLVSFFVFAAAVVLRLGLGATPFETTDSAGRAMGFNDPLGAEHYVIVARNFVPADFLALEYGYEWLLLLMHAIGAWLLLFSRRSGTRATRWFFAAQLLIFPLGLPCLFVMFPMASGILTLGMDRESFVDVPFFIFTVQPVWALTSLLVMLGLRGPGLGLSKWRDACSQALRAGRRKVEEAIR